MAEFIPDLPAVKAYLERKGEEPFVTKTGLMLNVSLEHDHISRLDIRQPYPGLLRFTVPLPLDFPLERLPAVAHELALINRRLLVPGFFIQPKPPCGVIFVSYVYMNHDGSVSSEVVDKVIHVCRNTASQFFERIAAVAEGREASPQNELPTEPQSELPTDDSEPPSDPA